MEAYAAAASRKTAEKEQRSDAGGGPKNAAEKKHARLMLKNLELDGETARTTGSKTEKVLQNPVPLDFPLQLGPGQEEEEDGDSSESKTASGRKRRKMTYRLGMEYIDLVAENPLPPMYQPVRSFDLGFIERQERFVAKQMAEREERESILRQLEEFGYADVEIEVPDEDDLLAIRRCEEWASQN